MTIPLLGTSFSLNEITNELQVCLGTIYGLEKLEKVCVCRVPVDLTPFLIPVYTYVIIRLHTHTSTCVCRVPVTLTPSLIPVYTYVSIRQRTLC
jgi:hypothetical protein